MNQADLLRQQIADTCPYLDGTREWRKATITPFTHHLEAI